MRVFTCMWATYLITTLEWNGFMDMLFTSVFSAAGSIFVGLPPPKFDRGETEVQLAGKIRRFANDFANNCEYKSRKISLFLS